MQMLPRLAESCPKRIFGMKNKIKKPAHTAGSVLIWVVIWHITASLANKNLLLKIPLPINTFKAFCENLTTLKFWQAVGVSMLHIITGFALALVFGLLCSIAANYSAIFKTLSAPLFHLIRSVPVAAFIVIAWLWIPTSVLPVFISFLMVFPIIKSHIDAGISAVDKKNIEMATVFGMSKSGILKHIKIPSVLPFFREGAITGLSIAWKSGIAAEVICNPSGSLGALLSGAKNSIDYEQVFAVTLAVVILSLIFENILKICWKEKKY